MAMKALRQHTHSFFQTLSRHKYIFIAAVAILILAITIPIAVIRNLKGRHHPMSSIIVPLYIYPAPGAWDPLYKAYTYPLRHVHIAHNLILFSGSRRAPTSNS